ncbi:hypothetical protein [Streptomyces sp. NPDC052701]|uniref:hypothetical protein n=1 Tax=Streptomyces sp. NPDC052701 TaxID=3155533 RepID=UPI00344887DF
MSDDLTPPRPPLWGAYWLDSPHQRHTGCACFPATRHVRPPGGAGRTVMMVLACCTIVVGLVLAAGV